MNKLYHFRKKHFYSLFHTAVSAYIKDINKARSDLWRAVISYHFMCPTGIA